MELEDLPDNEIRQRLIALGQSVGPVTQSTRALHIKKLRNLLASKGNESDFGQTELPSMTNGNGVDHPEILDNDSVAQAEPPLTQLRDAAPSSETPRAAKAAPQSAISTAVADDGSDGEMWGEESVRYLSPEEMELEMNYSTNSPTPKAFHSGNFRQALLVVFLMALVVFIFFLSDRVHRQTAGSAGEEEL